MKTIIQLRGTSGSGKSTLARRVVELYGGGRQLYHKSGRKQPTAAAHLRSGYGYALRPSGGMGGPGLFVPGHYNSACGGCDTLSGFEEVFGLVRQGLAQGYDVLFEGLLCSAETKRAIELHAWCVASRDACLHTIFLDTPLRVCLDAINARRLAKWESSAKKKGKPPPPPVPEKNTASKHRGVMNVYRSFSNQGLSVVLLDREAAFLECRRLLDV